MNVEVACAGLQLRFMLRFSRASCRAGRYLQVKLETGGDRLDWESGRTEEDVTSATVRVLVSSFLILIGW